MNEEQSDIEKSTEDSAANDAEGQGFRGHRTDQPTPPKDTGAEAADGEERNEEVEGQSMPFRRN